MSIDFSTLNSYSQYGEDIVAYHILKSVTLHDIKGIFVDIGCGHPIEFNNTYFYYLKGWRGLNIDASSEYQSAYNEFRPKDTFMNTAVSSEEKSIIYHEFSPYFYSTCETERVELLKKNPNVKFIGEKKITSLRIDTILSEYKEKMNGRLEIDFMSIDVEGFEYEVVSSNEWNIFRPKLLLVEIMGLIKNNGLVNTDTYKYLCDTGYSLKAITQSTFFFVDNTSSYFNQYPELPLGKIIPKMD